jgi:DNA-directed RNA polymerase specialized sigma24 family protein
MAPFTLVDHPDYRIPEPTTEIVRRINGVLPMLTGMTRRWLRHLPARHRDQFDAEDVLQELWAALIAKDHHYDPARSKYTTFSRIVAWQRLAELADQLNRGPRQEALGFDPAGPDDNSVFESATHAEAAERASRRLRPALERLDDSHHFVVTRSFGIGTTPMGATEQAAWLLCTVPRVLLLRSEGERELRHALVG